MKQLVSFSIETDSLIHLIFKDGSQYRVKKSDLATLLSPEDLQKVMGGFRTRRKYFNQTLPPWARAVAIAVIAISIGAGSMRAYSVMMEHLNHHKGLTGTGSTAIATPAPHPSAVAVSSSSQAPTPSPKSDSATPTSTASDIAVMSPAATPPLTAVVAQATSPSKDITLPLGITVPNPVPTVVQAAKQLTSPVTSGLSKLGL